jgi:hypothetical protein
MAVTANPDPSAACAASRAAAVRKKTRTDSSRSSIALGAKSSTIPSIMSVDPERTSRAG